MLRDRAAKISAGTGLAATAGATAVVAYNNLKPEGPNCSNGKNLPPECCEKSPRPRGCPEGPDPTCKSGSCPDILHCCTPEELQRMSHAQLHRSRRQADRSGDAAPVAPLPRCENVLRQTHFPGTLLETCVTHCRESNGPEPGRVVSILDYTIAEKHLLEDFRRRMRWIPGSSNMSPLFGDEVPEYYRNILFPIHHRSPTESPTGEGTPRRPTYNRQLGRIDKRSPHWPNGLWDEQGRGYPNIMPRCEVTARQHLWPHPLREMTTRRCIQSDGRVRYILEFVVDEARRVYNWSPRQQPATDYNSPPPRDHIQRLFRFQHLRLRREAPNKTLDDEETRTMHTQVLNREPPNSTTTDIVKDRPRRYVLIAPLIPLWLPFGHLIGRIIASLIPSAVVHGAVTGVTAIGDHIHESRAKRSVRQIANIIRRWHLDARRRETTPRSTDKTSSPSGDGMVFPGAEAASPHTESFRALIETTSHIIAPPNFWVNINKIANNKNKTSARPKRSPAPGAWNLIWKTTQAAITGITKNTPTIIKSIPGVAKLVGKRLIVPSLKGVASATTTATLVVVLSIWWKERETLNMQAMTMTPAANSGRPCLEACFNLSGYCTYCGAVGRCCKRGDTERGCQEDMGIVGIETCIHVDDTVLEAALNQIMNGIENPDDRDKATQAWLADQLVGRNHAKVEIAVEAASTAIGQDNQYGLNQPSNDTLKKATRAARAALSQVNDDGQSKKEDVEFVIIDDVLIAANINRSCAMECSQPGLCPFCGPLGLCCQLYSTMNGCSGSMGTLQQAVCVEPTDAATIEYLKFSEVNKQKIKTLERARAHRGRRDTLAAHLRNSIEKNMLIPGAGTALIQDRLNITVLPGGFYEKLTTILSKYQWPADGVPVMKVIDGLHDMMLALLPISLASAATTKRADAMVKGLGDKHLLHVRCGNLWEPTGGQTDTECRQKETIIKDYLNTELDIISSKMLASRTKRQVRPDQFAGAQHYGPQYEPPPIPCHLAVGGTIPFRHPLYTISWRTCLSSNGVPVRLVLFLLAEHNMLREYQHRLHWLPRHLGNLPHDHVPEEARAILQHRHFSFLYNNEEAHLRDSYRRTHEGAFTVRPIPRAHARPEGEREDGARRIPNGRAPYDEVLEQRLAPYRPIPQCEIVAVTSHYPHPLKELGFRQCVREDGSVGSILKHICATARRVYNLECFQQLPWISSHDSYRTPPNDEIQRRLLNLANNNHGRTKRNSEDHLPTTNNGEEGNNGTRKERSPFARWAAWVMDGILSAPVRLARSMGSFVDDHLTFPSAAATGAEPGHKPWIQKTAAHLPPPKAAYKRFEEPHLVHTAMGQAGVDVQYRTTAITFEMKSIVSSTFTLLQQALFHCQREFQGQENVPRPKVWKVENPDLTQKQIELLIHRDNCLDLANDLANIKRLTSNTHTNDSNRTKRAADVLLHGYEEALLDLTINLNEDEWIRVLDGRILTDDKEGYYFIAPEAGNSTAGPAEAGQHAEKTADYRRERLIKRDGRKVTTINALWNFLHGIADQAKYHRAHTLVHSLNNNPLVISTKQHIHGFLGKTAERFKQLLSSKTHATEGTDPISRDVYIRTRRAMDDVMRLIATAGAGRLDPAQFPNLPWDEMAKDKAEESEQGYESLASSPFDHVSIQTTVAAVYVKGQMTAIQAIMYVPYAHHRGRMTAYKVIETPLHIDDDYYMTLVPDQERVILVGHHPADGTHELPWVALTATEFSQCRPGGKFYTCAHIRTLRAPVADRPWPHADADICSYALYTQKATLAVTACNRREVIENTYAKSIGPFSWVVFSRQPHNLRVSCPERVGHDPTERLIITGVGIIRLPEGCSATLGGTVMLADRLNAATAEKIYHAYPVLDLITAATRADTEYDKRLADVYHSHNRVPRDTNQRIQSGGEILFDSIINLANMANRDSASEAVDQHWSVYLVIFLTGAVTVIAAILGAVALRQKFQWEMVDRHFDWLRVIDEILTDWADETPNGKSQFRHNMEVLDDRLRYLEGMCHSFTYSLTANNIPYAAATPPATVVLPALTQYVKQHNNQS